ncbi:MAG: hypothetical protein ACI8TP_003339 [Acidimicrobiales bacterium]|jgi:hypothetical protein
MSQPDKHAADDAELPEFGDLINNLRAGATVEPETPPSSVWQKIEAATHPVSDLAEARVSDLAEARVSDLADARRRRDSIAKRGAILTAVAAALLLVAVPIGLAIRGSGNDVLLASAELEVIGQGAVVPGQADLVQVNDDIALELEAFATTQGSDFLELWLLKFDADGGLLDAVSLGSIVGSGRYDVPDDLDLTGSWKVDISVEVDDGDDEHGGNSVLRGDLA